MAATCLITEHIDHGNQKPKYDRRGESEKCRSPLVNSSQEMCRFGMKILDLGVVKYRDTGLSKTSNGTLYYSERNKYHQSNGVINMIGSPYVTLSCCYNYSVLLFQPFVSK